MLYITIIIHSYIHCATASACQVATVKLLSTEDKTKVRTPMISNNSFWVLAWITFTTASKIIKITDSISVFGLLASLAFLHSLLPLQHPSNSREAFVMMSKPLKSVKLPWTKQQAAIIHFTLTCAFCACSPQGCPLSQLIPLITKHDPSASCPLLARPLQASHGGTFVSIHNFHNGQRTQEKKHHLHRSQLA